jgi:hypothetical protein
MPTLSEVHRMSAGGRVSHANAVYEKVGDVQPKYSINLERCDLVRVSMRVQCS